MSGPPSQSVFPLVRWLLEMDMRLCPLCRTVEHQTSARQGYPDSKRGLRTEDAVGWRLNSPGPMTVRQFYPVGPVVYRQLLVSKPVYLFLNRLLASRSARERVRTEAGCALMMAREPEELLVCEA
jgi:hypothetical protein